MANATIQIINDLRWAAIIARDSKADGLFFYAVKTTGVYCRPSCGSRTPNLVNVYFYSTIKEAEHAGFRPCKRCKPNQPSIPEQHTMLVTKLCQQIKDAETIPSLKDLAHHAHISPSHLHRIFKAIVGITPKAYAIAHRAQKIRDKLNHNHSITETIYAAGYNSNSRFYTESNQLLGMSPKHFRSGGAHIVIHFAVDKCSLGTILIASSERGVCAILIGHDSDVLVQDLQRRFHKATLIDGDNEFKKIVTKVIQFVEMPKLGLDLPLDLRGTAFQQRVWQALQKIPIGTTVSYTEIAQRIGAPKSVRAVAQACAANHIAVAIPCHRVIRNDGKLSGYRWGIECKKALLKKEAKV